MVRAFATFNALALYNKNLIWLKENKTLRDKFTIFLNTMFVFYQLYCSISQPFP